MNRRDVFLRLPRELMKEFCILAVINFLYGIMMDAGSFLIQFSKNAMADGLVALSLALLALHYVRSPFEQFISTFLEDQHILYDEHRDIHLTKKAATVLLKVKGKVQHRNEQQGFEEKMPSSKILRTCHDYLSYTWRRNTFFIKNGIDIISAIIMFIGLIAASTLEITHTGIFIVLIVLASFINLFFCNLRLKTRNLFRNEQRKARMITEEAQQNILRFEPINNEHAQFMTDNYVVASQKSFSLQRTVRRKINFLMAGNSLSTTLFTLALLALKIWEVGFENVDLLTLMSAISLVTIYSQFTRRINGFIHIRDEWRDIVDEQKVFEPDFNNIFAVYEIQAENDEIEAARISNIVLPTFKVKYNSRNGDQAFELVSSEEISVKPGDFLVLTGTTGSGKSTLIKMLTNNLQFDGFSLCVNSESGNGAAKSVMHQDRTMLGSTSVLNEITLGKADYDREKLLQILCALNLYQELREKTSDVFDFLNNCGIDQFSNGQIQRLAIARTLMNLDDSVQIIAFDEATNNLNDEIGLQVLQFIKETCKDMIVIFATHQTNIAFKVATKHLHFTHSDADNCYYVSTTNS